MKTLVKILLTTLLMGTGLAIAAQSPHQATGANMTPTQMQNMNMGSVMSMLQNIMGAMNQGIGMTGQAGMMHGGMANSQAPAPKPSSKLENCAQQSHQHMDHQEMINGQQAS